MMTGMLRTFLILALLILASAPSLAYNTRFEQRVATQLLEVSAEKEVVWLQAAGEEFLALYRNQERQRARGAVILLHGMGAHPDWPEVIAPLREQLPALGWSTLSIQLPVLSPEEPVADYGKTLDPARTRIQSAIRQLREWNYSNIIIIAYSFGAATAVHSLGAGDVNGVLAFAGISMQAQQFLNPRLKLLDLLATLDLPVLDIYGSRDALEVVRGADDRRLAGLKNGNAAYQQIVIEGADAYFSGLDEVLLKRIQGWLHKVSPVEEMQIKRQGDDENETKQEAKSSE